MPRSVVVEGGRRRGPLRQRPPARDARDRRADAARGLQRAAGAEGIK